MNLLEIFETGIVSNILPSDVFAVLMLITTSKTVKNKILDIRPKVDVDLTNRRILTSHFKKICDILLSIESFSKIIQKLSNMFIIDTLNLQDLKIQRSIFTENIDEISYFDVISVYCKSLRKLYVTCYYDENILVREFIKNMPNCKVSHFHKKYGILGYSPGDHNCFYSNGLKYYDTNIYGFKISYESIPLVIKNNGLSLDYIPPDLDYIPPEILLKNIDIIKRLKKLNLNAQRNNNKFKNKFKNKLNL